MAKYIKYIKDYWTYETIFYDSETLIQTIVRQTGSTETKKEKQMTKEEMINYAQNEHIRLFSQMNEEIKKIQNKYEKDIKQLENFKKALDT
jgi:phage host-nuclease inhibitor protein Gam